VLARRGALQHATHVGLAGATAGLPVQEGLQVALELQRRLRRKRIVAGVLGVAGSANSAASNARMIRRCTTGREVSTA